MAEFTTSIEIAATPADVFEFLVTKEGLTAWMGQGAELDARVGGAFAADIAGHAVRGRYLEVEPPHRVSVSWGMVGSSDLPVGASTVTFELTATPRGTRVDLLHTNLPETQLEGHADGWGHFLPRLQVAAPGGDAGEDDWAPLQPTLTSIRPRPQESS